MIKLQNVCKHYVVNDKVKNTSTYLFVAEINRMAKVFFNSSEQYKANFEFLKFHNDIFNNDLA